MSPNEKIIIDIVIFVAALCLCQLSFEKKVILKITL